MKIRNLIQASIEPKLFDKIELAAKKRGINKAGTFNRVILTELEAKGYFDNSFNEIIIKKK